MIWPPTCIAIRRQLPFQAVPRQRRCSAHKPDDFAQLGDRQAAGAVLVEALGKDRYDSWRRGAAGWLWKLFRERVAHLSEPELAEVGLPPHDANESVGRA